VIGLVACDGVQLGELPFLVPVPVGAGGELGRVAGTHDRQRDEPGHEEEDDDRCSHGSNSLLGNFLPPVAELTSGAKILPLR
jgi:hypothetical protein